MPRWREGTAGHGRPSIPVATDGVKGPLTMDGRVSLKPWMA
ncbi:MAG: hypothetical protein WA125_03290 [Desulfosporosinus sp.]